MNYKWVQFIEANTDTRITIRSDQVSCIQEGSNNTTVIHMINSNTTFTVKDGEELVRMRLRAF